MIDFSEVSKSYGACDIFNVTSSRVEDNIRKIAHF